MKSKVTLTNDFHNTSITLITEVLDFGVHQEITLTTPQMKRSAKILCGVKGCTCGGPAGVRGRQEFNGKKLVVNHFPADSNLPVA